MDFCSKPCSTRPMSSGEQQGVTVVGSCNMDLICYVIQLPRKGETVTAVDYQEGCGGKGANQAVACALLGSPVHMVAAVGADEYGEAFLAAMRRARVNIDHIHRLDGVRTGFAAISVEDSGENSIVIVPGANSQLSSAHLEKAADTISKSKIVVCQLEVDTAVTLEALKKARELGVLTLFNPAPAIPNLDPEFFTNTDIICVNETEAMILTRKPCTGAVEAAQCGRTLVSFGCRAAVVTLGAEGAVLVHKDVVSVVTPPDLAQAGKKVVDTTGSGDCFVGAMAHLISSSPFSEVQGGLGRQLQDLVRRAVAIASCSVLRPGTQKSYPSRDELTPAVLDLAHDYPNTDTSVPLV